MWHPYGSDAAGSAFQSDGSLLIGIRGRQHRCGGARVQRRLCISIRLLTQAPTRASIGSSIYDLSPSTIETINPAVKAKD